jgi:hypothetical protein
LCIAAQEGCAECIRVLHELGADINKCRNTGGSPVLVAASNNKPACVQVCVQLGANVERLFWAGAFFSAATQTIMRDIRTFLTASALNTSPHQYTLYSSAQLATYYLQRHHYPDQPEVVRDFTFRFAVEIQDRLVVAPFAAAAGEETTTPARRLLVLLAARTAIDAAVAETAAAVIVAPTDAKVVADVMNLLMSRAALRDLHSLRLVCKLAYRGSFPVPRRPLLELPTGVVESFLGGSCSRMVSFDSMCKALTLHAEAAP